MLLKQFTRLTPIYTVVVFVGCIAFPNLLFSLFSHLRRPIDTFSVRQMLNFQTLVELLVNGKNDSFVRCTAKIYPVYV